VADKASKQTYAGYRFERDALTRRFGDARRDLEILARPPRSLKPGKYRAYLTPDALRELFGLLGWQGFSRRAFETRTSPLLALGLGEVALDERIQLSENTHEGAGPGFSRAGFEKPDRVSLVANGRFAESLTSPRSAEEYKCAHNGADDNESPSALDLAPGELARDDVLGALDDGLHISNLWYTNFSDRKSCRVTGMTRFATLWVEGGKVAAPVNVMRFDDSLYRVLGSELEALTKERDLFLDSDTYFARKTGSSRFPGALISQFDLVL
jgi:predicted Zn-dependent protease